jgi:hypothetical protein
MPRLKTGADSRFQQTEPHGAPSFSPYRADFLPSPIRLFAHSPFRLFRALSCYHLPFQANA